MITQTTLKEFLNYNPDSGIFTWIKRPPRSRVNVGQPAGHDDGDGYLRVQLLGKGYRLNRLAFLYMQGYFPPRLSDHKNGIRTDNRWENLRPATHSQNCQNVVYTRKNKWGHRGIYKSGNFWIARPMHDGKFHYLGCFATPELAADAYNDFCKKHHKEFYRP